MNDGRLVKGSHRGVPVELSKGDGAERARPASRVAVVPRLGAWAESPSSIAEVFAGREDATAPPLEGRSAHRFALPSATAPVNRGKVCASRGLRPAHGSCTSPEGDPS